MMDHDITDLVRLLAAHFAWLGLGYDDAALALLDQFEDAFHDLSDEIDPPDALH